MEKTAMVMQQCRRFRRDEASIYLKEKWGLDRKPSTLAKYASLGGGPMFEYAGRIPIYPQDQLDVWAQSILSALCSSTAEKPSREVEDCGASSTESATR
jgi:hypothetical protein